MSGKKIFGVCAILLVVLLAFCWADRQGTDGRKDGGRGITLKFFQILAEDIRRTGEDNEVTSPAYDENYQRLLVGRKSGEVDIWDMKRGSKRTVAVYDHNFIGWLKFTPDGRKFFTGIGFDITSIRILDAGAGEMLYRAIDLSWPVIHTGVDDLYLLADTRGYLCFLDLAVNRHYTTSHRPGNVNSLAVDPETGLVAIGPGSGTLELFKADFSGETPRLDKIEEVKPHRVRNHIQALYFSPGFLPGTKRLFTVTSGGEFDCWSVPALKNSWGQPVSTIVLGVPELGPGRHRPAPAVVIGRDGQVRSVPPYDLAAFPSSIPVLARAEGHGLGAVALMPDLKKIIAIQGAFVTVIDLDYVI